MPAIRVNPELFLSGAGDTTWELLLGARVGHYTYGSGTITRLGGNTFWIRFDNSEQPGSENVFLRKSMKLGLFTWLELPSDFNVKDETRIWQSRVQLPEKVAVSSDTAKLAKDSRTASVGRQPTGITGFPYIQHVPPVPDALPTSPRPHGERPANVERIIRRSVDLEVPARLDVDHTFAFCRVLASTRDIDRLVIDFRALSVRQAKPG
jgi:hypothetical protein